jgi:nickel/cobalt transporter (NicO) family protein
MRRSMPVAIWLGLQVLLICPSAIAHPGHGSLLIQHLGQASLSPILMLSGMGIALMAGAGHALTPGHGKTMIAAYLSGSRGTPQQAIWLGVITTFTHTISVFVLGILVLCLSRYILPEQLYPLLSWSSGLMICGVGFSLLDRQVNSLAQPSSHDYDDHSLHHHDDQSQMTLRSFITLGIAGGLVPCPSALVLLLSAIAFHQIAYGLLLVSTFSLGLAIALIAIGLTVIYTHQWFKLVPSFQPLQQYIPIVSAIAVIVAGSFIITCSVV